MICDALWPGSVSIQPSFSSRTNPASRAPVWTLANGTIDMTSRSGGDGGVYNISTEMEVYLEVFDIVESIPTSVPNLPTCGVSRGFSAWSVQPTDHMQQMCVSAELSLGPSFGCSSSNYTCLCGSSPFNTAFRDCVLGCYTLDDMQDSKDYWDIFCVEEGVLPA